MEHFTNMKDANTVSLYDVQMRLEVIKFLFINRTDVYAQYFEEKHLWFPPKDKRSGSHEPVTGTNILDHLNGYRRIGAYSTNMDHQVKWIVADFDDNEKAYEQCIKTQKTLNKYKLSSHIERSFSGKGYHLWVFFDQPVLAVDARRLMLGALTEANIPFTGKFQKGSNNNRAMDRLIPTQNRLPIGGLGNLVCMPLNGKAMQQGNTCFLDNQGNPYANQFAYLYVIAWSGRVNIEQEGAQHLINLIDMPENPTEDKPWDLMISADQIDMLRGCEAIKQGIENANQFNNFTWMGILTNIAVFGSKGRDLAHEFSAGYDMRHVKQDAAAVYSEDETDRVYFHKVDYIQKGGHPTSCKRIAEEGWECPLLHSCTYKHIAKFGSDALTEIAITNEQTKENYRHYGPDQIAKTFEEIVLNSTAWQTLFNGKFFNEGVWLDNEFVPYEKPNLYDITKMLLGVPSKIEAYDKNGNTKFIVIEFSTQNSANLFAKKVNGLVDSENKVWIFYKQKVGACAESIKLHQIANSMGLYPLDDPYMIERWVDPPFREGVKWGDYENGIEALMEYNYITV